MGPGISGVAEFVNLTNTSNTEVTGPTGGFVVDAFTFDTTVVNLIPISVVPSVGANGTIFTLSPGYYILDYEMSLASINEGSSKSIAIAKGLTVGTMVVDNNTIAGSETTNTWIHGRAYVNVPNATTLIVCISPVSGTANVVSSERAGPYVTRLMILKIL